LARAAVGTLARSRGVLFEASFSDVAIVGHRTLRVDSTLVRLHSNTSARQDRDN
jgi:hypothetical protein